MAKLKGKPAQFMLVLIVPNGIITNRFFLHYRDTVAAGLTLVLEGYHVELYRLLTGHPGVNVLPDGQERIWGRQTMTDWGRVWDWMD